MTASTTMFRRITAIVATTAITTLGFGLTSSPASAATAYHTGDHVVAAQSLTLYNNGPVLTMTRGDHFNIDHFADNNQHAWGSYIGQGGCWYGWVWNGWFQ